MLVFALLVASIPVSVAPVAAVPKHGSYKPAPHAVDAEPASTARSESLVRTSTGPVAPAVGYRMIKSANVPMHVVQIDPRRGDVRMALVTPSEGIGVLETWSSLIDRARPAAAITGTYFDTKTNLPVGCLWMDGQSLHDGLVGTAFTFTPGEGAQIVTTKPYRRYDWGHAGTTLRAGPRLLTGGEQTLWPGAEGFRDPAVFARKKRTAIAITRSGRLLLVAVERPVQLRELAAALKSIGAVDAMCLDGGSSTGLYHRGKSHVVPQRSLTNLLVVYDDPDRYLAQRTFLNPALAE
jgi:hypothetical protein